MMKSERQFRLLSLILLGVCGLIFIRQMSVAPAQADAKNVAVAAAVVNDKPTSLSQEEIKPRSVSDSTDLEVQSVIEVENINSGKLPSFNAGIDSEK
jgi:hypothetical protein